MTFNGDIADIANNKDKQIQHILVVIMMIVNCNTGTVSNNGNGSFNSVNSASALLPSPST